MLIKLTMPNGETEEFKPDSITNIRKATEGVYPPAAKTIVRCDGQDFAVRETREEIDLILSKVRE